MACRGRGCRSVSLPLNGLAVTPMKPANQRKDWKGRKDTHPTPMLGVICRWALSTYQRERPNLACMLKLRGPALHLFMLRLFAWLCTKGYMPCRQGLYKRWLAGRPDNRASWIKLTKMFDVPGVAHLDTIFSLQADCARPGDSYYPIRSFPLWRQLVGILG